MKIKKKIYIFLIIFLFTQVSFSKETQIDSSNIKILEEGNIINAYEAIANIPDEKIKIEGDKAIYNKSKKILTVENGKGYVAAEQQKKDDKQIIDTAINSSSSIFVSFFIFD